MQKLMIQVSVSRPIDATVRDVLPMHKWGAAEIAEYFDSHPNITLTELARWTQRTVPELKKLLMPAHG